MRQQRFTCRKAGRSALVESAGWFSVGLLIVRLKSGEVYAYHPGPSIVRLLWRSYCRSKSKGRWFNRRVKGEYPGVKLDGELKREVEGYLTNATSL